MNTKTLYRMLLISVLAFASETYTMDNTTTAYLAVGSMVLGSCGYGVGYVANRLAVSRARSAYAEELNCLLPYGSNDVNAKIIRSITHKHNAQHSSWFNAYFADSNYKGFPLIEALATIQSYRRTILFTLPFTCCLKSGNEARRIYSELGRIQDILLASENYTSQLQNYPQYQTLQIGFKQHAS